MPMQIRSTQILEPEQPGEPWTIDLMVGDAPDIESETEYVILHFQVSHPTDAYLPALQRDAMGRAIAVFQDQIRALQAAWKG